MHIALLLAISGLALLPAAGAAQDSIAVGTAHDSTAPGTARVSYLAGGSVYIDAGRQEGLVEGADVTLMRNGAIAATLRVQFLSSHQASCAVASGATDIAVGETVRYRPAAPPRASASAPGKARVAGPRGNRKAGIHGRVGGRYLVVKDDVGTGFSQPGFDTRIEGQQLLGTPLGLVGDLRVRRARITRSDGSTAVDGRTRVYQAALLWNTPGAPFRMAVGRQYLGRISSIGLFDGGLLEFNGRHLALGAFGGLEPEPSDLGFSRQTQDYGGYVELHSAPGQRSTWSVTTGAVGSYASGAANREFGFLQATLSGPVLSFYGTQELDYYRPWKVAVGEKQFSPTSTYASAVVRFARGISLNGGWDNRRNVRLFRDVVNPATEFDDTYRQGAWGGFNLVGHRIRLGGDMRRSTGGSQSQVTSYTGTFGLDRLTPMRINLGVRGTWYRNRSSTTLADSTGTTVSRITTAGSLLSAHLNFDPLGPVHLDVEGGLRREHDPRASIAARTFKWYGATLDVNLARAWYTSLSATREQGPDGRTDQVYSSLSWRF